MEKIEVCPGVIVRSLKGRDCGNIYMIIETVNPEFVLVCDGKKRKTANPKLKRLKHLKVLDRGLSPSDAEINIQDSLIVHTLKNF